MRKSLLPGLIAGGAAAAAVAGMIVADRTMSSGPVTIVDGGAAAGPVRTSSAAPLDPPPSVTAPEDCIAITNSLGSTNAAPGTQRCGLASHVTLQDRVYFGALWQILDETPATATIVLGGGYANARVERTADGDFFAGIVDKAGADGRITDVILAFAGAQGADAVQGESILVGLPLDEAARATGLYERLLADPRYAEARIHVTGHSLGAGYTQYVLAYALATHGAAATDGRADFLAFGAPNWLYSAAVHFGVSPDALDARMVDFTAANDPVLVNGIYRTGINNYLPAFTGLTGIGAALNVIAAHWPTTYASALGMPAWLPPAARDAAVAAVSAQFATGDAIDPAYGPAGALPLTIDGGAGATWLQGMDGDDRLTGKTGGDILTGGKGADRFVFRTASDSGTSSTTSDRITDFSQSEHDRIDLSAFALPLVGGLRFRGSDAFDGARQVRVAYRGGDTIVSVSLDSDPTPEMTIVLDGRIALRSSDFVLTN